MPKSKEKVSIRREKGVDNEIKAKLGTYCWASFDLGLPGVWGGSVAWRVGHLSSAGRQGSVLLLFPVSNTWSSIDRSSIAGLSLFT